MAEHMDRVVWIPILDSSQTKSIWYPTLESRVKDLRDLGRLTYYDAPQRGPTDIVRDDKLPVVA